MANNQPDNLLARVTRLYVSQKSFKNDKGENVEYQRLVLEGEIKEEAFELEFPITKKDVTLLRFADVINEDLVGQE